MKLTCKLFSHSSNTQCNTVFVLRKTLKYKLLSGGAYKSAILLPLCPASLTHKNPQRRKIICGMRPVGRKDRLIDLKTFFVEYPFCVISVAVLAAVVQRRLFLFVFVVLYTRRRIFLFK